MIKIHKQALSSFLIFLFGGMVQMLLCWNCLQYPYFLSFNFFVTFIYAGSVWVLLWKGSELMVVWQDKLVPWLEAPLRRFLFSTVFIVLYVFLVVWLVDLFFDMLVLNKTFKEATKETGADMPEVIVVTFLMNVFMHGRTFLLSWRQSSIDVEKLKTEQVAMQYESLKNQVNPHFLFNSLNVLSSLVYDNQDKAVLFIRKLSQVYRYVLDKKDVELVTIPEELNFAENFIFLQKIRFGDNLKVTVDIKRKKGYLPPLALQLLIENAIKHNVVSEKHPLNILVKIEDDVCLVENTRKEKFSKDSTGIGLKNLRERYKYLTDTEVKIDQNEDRFTVYLPILNSEK